MFPWSLENMQVLQVAQLLGVVRCESVRVTAIYLSPGVSPTFVTIALLLPANYTINVNRQWLSAFYGL